MTTVERLMNVGWVNLSHFSELTILGRGDDRILYNPRTENVERTYKVKEFDTRIISLKVPGPVDLFNIFSGEKVKV